MTVEEALRWLLGASWDVHLGVGTQDFASQTYVRLCDCAYYDRGHDFDKVVWGPLHEALPAAVQYSKEQGRTP